MILLRLFEASNPFHQIEERLLERGELTIGRDPSADWSINDERGDLSRKHCILSLRAGRVYLFDTSSNGVRAGADKQVLPRGEHVQLSVGDMVYLGQYMILIDGDRSTVEKVQRRPALPREVATSSAAPTDAALLESFCQGAGLEPSAFAGESPADVMMRLGGLYRQIIDDLCGLMQDRAQAKDKLQLDRTTITARDNNPLKWAPPHRIAVELLQEGEEGFLKGAEAFQASFADLRRHGAGLAAGSKAAVRYVLEELSPDAVEAGVKRQPLAFVSRHDAAWKRYRERHAELAAEVEGDGPGGIDRALRAGYEGRASATDTIGGAA